MGETLKLVAENPTSWALILVFTLVYLFSRYLERVDKRWEENAREERRVSSEVALAQVAVAKALTEIAEKMEALPDQLRAVIIEMRNYPRGR